MSRALKRVAHSLTIDDLLRNSPWFGALGTGAQAEVRRAVFEREIGAGQTLSHRGETQHHWIGVLEGLLTWSIVTIEGKAVSFSGQAPGAWFGEGTLLRGQPRQSELVSLRHTRVALLPREVFEWLRSTEPSFNEFLLMQINERLHWFMGNFAAYGLLNVDRLVARALAGLVHPLLNPSGDRYLHITQEELASLAAVSRPRCNRSLVGMAQQGLVELEYGAVRVLDLARLQAFAAA